MHHVLQLIVCLPMIAVECCVNRTCWCFTTKGMCTVGQDEVVIVLECLPDESSIPRDIFCHLHSVYEQASKGEWLTNPWLQDAVTVSHKVSISNFEVGNS